MNYWDKVLHRRIARRRALLTTGSAGLGAAFLAACGDDDDDAAGSPTSSPATNTPASSSATGASTPSASPASSGSTGAATGAGGLRAGKPTDETAKAIPGGTFKWIALRDPNGNFEPHTSGGGSFSVVQYTYNTLFRVVPGLLDFPDGEVVGDLAESFEMSPDKLTLTLKVNHNAHFAPVDPVNGRALDAQDIMFSWNRFSELSPRRGLYLNDVAPTAPIASMEAPDDSTVVIHLAKPYAIIYSLLTGQFAGDLYIGPKEAADTDKLDLAHTALGTGAFYVSEHRPSIGFTYKKNPAFHGGDKTPFVDQIDMPVIQEYAAAMAQFRAGEVYQYGVNQEDIFQTLEDVPDLVLNEAKTTASSFRLIFGVAPTSVFHDERVRQAWMLTHDRDLWLDAFNNVDSFESKGLNVERAWECAVQYDTWKGWYLDPQSSEFGPSSKFFKQDVAEAKKLLDAAGFPEGVTTKVNEIKSGSDFGSPSYFRGLELSLAMVDDSGLFKYERVQHAYRNEFLPQFVLQTQGMWDDMAYMIAGFQGDPVTIAHTFYHPDGQFSEGTDDEIAGFIESAQSEFDGEKRKALMLDLQRHEGKTVFFPRMASSTGFELHWPILRNWGTFLNGDGRELTKLFLDPSQAPGA